MTANYMYEGIAGYEWLDSATALRKAIMASLQAGWDTVPMRVADFCAVMQHANSADTKSLVEQLLAFAGDCGLRFTLENHSQYVRFYV